jgi:protein-ribulosamine 3-kinase
MVFFYFYKMLTKPLKEYLSDFLELKIKCFKPISGGDISTAYKIETDSKNFFLKTNSHPDALKMFMSEKEGLTAISETKTIATPKVYECNAINNQAFLLLQYIESKYPEPNDFKVFATKLAQLHGISSTSCGFSNHNFIGSLHQNNTTHNNWCDFYIKERLLPQLHLAYSKGILNSNEIPDPEILKSVCSPVFEGVKPSLLHGDLWSGNYLISKSGIPFLIDPAIYFGHSEVDIAMSKLFGGFLPEFYQEYYKHIKRDHFTDRRIEVYQLYYLLVHLNLFGKSYYSNVKSILNRVF